MIKTRDELFRFKGDDGEQASVLIYRILGFNQAWPDKRPPAGFQTGILVENRSGDIMMGSSEPIADLETRFLEQMARVRQSENEEAYSWPESKKEIEP